MGSLLLILGLGVSSFPVNVRMVVCFALPMMPLCVIVVLKMLTIAAATIHVHAYRNTPAKVVIYPLHRTVDPCV